MKLTKEKFELVRYKVLNQNKDQLYNQLLHHQVLSKVYNQVELQIKPQIYFQIEDQIWGQVLDEIESSLGSSVRLKKKKI